MLRLLATGGLAIAAALPSAGLADARDASEAFAAASAAFDAGDYSRALSLFESARDAGSKGPAVHYDIAVCHYRLGNYARAESEFRSLGERFPQMRELARYNLGLALLRQGRRSEARAYFEEVAESGADQTMRRLAETALRRLDGAAEGAGRGRPRWVSLIDLNVGQDDNVALVEEATLPAGQSQDSRFTELTAVVTGPVSSRPGFRFDGSAYAVDYSDAGQYDQSVIRLGGAYQWRKGAWRLEAGPHINYSTLDGDGFEQRYGASFAMRRGLGSIAVLGIRVAHEEIDEATSRYAFVAGSRERVSLTWDRYAASGRWSLGYDLELNDRLDPGVSPTRNRLALRYRRSMSQSWTLDTQLSFRASAYDDLATRRREDLTEVFVGLGRRLSGRWAITGRYWWSDNDANIDAYSYRRRRLALGITRSF